MRAARILLIQVPQGTLHRLGESSAVGHAGGLLGQTCELAGGQAQRGELLGLIAQQGQSRVAVPCLRFQLQGRIQQFQPHPVGNPDFPDGGFVAAVGVEQFALAGAAGQSLEFMLAVDVEQDVAGLAQLLHGHRLAVEIGA